jgi:hypothetical protein
VRSGSLPVYPDNQTFGISQKCHGRKWLGSFDHLIGAYEEGVRNRQLNRFGGAFIQSQFKPARLNSR